MITDSRQSARTLLDGAVDFHGHLGPFLILGMRMGVIARSILKPQSQDSLNAVVFVRSTPPASCTIDGIQVASKCTLGRGTIRVVEASDCIVGRFHLEGRTCTITVRPKVLNQLFEGVNTAAGGALVKMASDVMTASDEDLFEIESSKCPSWAGKGRVRHCQEVLGRNRISCVLPSPTPLALRKAKVEKR